MNLALPLLKAAGLGKVFADGGRDYRVLQNLDMSISAGSSVSLVGESGSGKSTFLHLLGLLDRPSEGEIFFEGESSKTWSEAKKDRFRSENMGFVFQRHLLLPEFTLLENVQLPLLKKLSKKESKEQALDLLKLMGLDHRSHARPVELSGGEAQRGAVCRALVHRPKLVLLDEPTGSLDPKSAHKIMDEVLRLCKSTGATSLLVTHNHELAKQSEHQYLLENHEFQKIAGAGL